MDIEIIIKISSFISAIVVILTSMSKINWKKINESLKASATSFKEAGEEFFSGVKASVVELNEDKRPSRDEIFEMVKNNPDLTSEEIAEMVRKARGESLE